jgi:hypothetical protein
VLQKFKYSSALIVFVFVKWNNAFGFLLRILAQFSGSKVDNLVCFSFIGGGSDKKMSGMRTLHVN